MRIASPRAPTPSSSNVAGSGTGDGSIPTGVGKPPSSMVAVSHVGPLGLLKIRTVLA